MTLIEVVCYAMWSAFSTSSAASWREAIYAVSAVFLAAAWLTARAWCPPGMSGQRSSKAVTYGAVPAVGSTGLPDSMYRSYGKVELGRSLEVIRRSIAFPDRQVV